MEISKFVRGGAMLLLAAPLESLTTWLPRPQTSWSPTSCLNFLKTSIFGGRPPDLFALGSDDENAGKQDTFNAARSVDGCLFQCVCWKYALGNMYPGLMVWRYVCHLMVMWLPLSWAYTFMKVPEDTRMATARVLAPNR